MRPGALGDVEAAQPNPVVVFPQRRPVGGVHRDDHLAAASPVHGEQSPLIDHNGGVAGTETTPPHDERPFRRP